MLLLKLALLAAEWLLASGYPFQHVSQPQAPKTAKKIAFLELIPPPRQPLPEPPAAPHNTHHCTHHCTHYATPHDTALAAQAPAPAPSPDRPRASMAATPPPTAEKWALGDELPIQMTT